MVYIVICDQELTLIHNAGTLHVHHIRPPFPRSLRGKLHILFAHLRQLHLTLYLLLTNASEYDVYFVDQLSTCIPFLRAFAKRRVVFYCHFPDKLLADGEFVNGTVRRRRRSVLKRLYRMPMDLLEEKTTGVLCTLQCKARFSNRATQHKPMCSSLIRNLLRVSSILSSPSLAHLMSCILELISRHMSSLSAWQTAVFRVSSRASSVLNHIKIGMIHIEKVRERPTMLSLNRFEKKKNAALALKAFALLHSSVSASHKHEPLRLVLAGTPASLCPTYESQTLSRRIRPKVARQCRNTFRTSQASRLENADIPDTM